MRRAPPLSPQVKFCLRFFLPGKDIRPEVGEPLPTPEDAPEDETEQWIG